VTLFKGATGLGMNLAGGGSHDNPITIKKIASGTAADQCGQLRLGDIILEVNGKSVTLLSAKEVISILRACPSEVQLLAKRSGGVFQQQQQQHSNNNNNNNMPVASSNY
jgi:C-terminal processing protease CtpA/Prc